jgi:hypothetical protein
LELGRFVSRLIGNHEDESHEEHEGATPARLRLGSVGRPIGRPGMAHWSPREVRRFVIFVAFMIFVAFVVSTGSLSYGANCK